VVIVDHKSSGHDDCNRSPKHGPQLIVYGKLASGTADGRRGAFLHYPVSGQLAEVLASE
jgi:hypothetical protein